MHKDTSKIVEELGLCSDFKTFYESQENKITYDKVIINASDKLTVCKENGIELFIEDSFETCKELEENGIKTYLMTTQMNMNINASNIERISNWIDLDKKIHKYLEDLTTKGMI